jgi:hypothetical protein
MSETTRSFVHRDLATAKAWADEWLDGILQGQWHEVTAAKTHDGQYRVTVRVRND